MKKKTTLMLLAIVGVIVFGMAVTMLFSQTLNPNNISISGVFIDEETVFVKGNLTDSAIGYKGYGVRNIDNKLYIKIKGNTFPLGKKDGSFDIAIDTGKYGLVEEVYLQDRTNNLKINPK